MQEVDATYVQVTTEDGVSTITWSRPDRRNAIGVDVSHELTSALGSVALRNDVDVIVLSSVEPPFCAGWDVKDLQELDGADPHTVEDFFGYGRALLAAVDDAPQIVVAKVRGAALGFGCSLLTRCDFVLAEEDSVFGLPEVALGMPPATALPEMLSVMSPRAALRWATTGDRFPALQARHDGLVSDIVSAADMDEELRALSRRLAEHPGSAVRATKRLMRRMTGMDLNRRVDVGVEYAVGQFAPEERT